MYRLKKDMSIVKQTEINLLTAPMGIFVDTEYGDLWVATQPVLYKALQHLRNPLLREHRSPSQVLRIRIQVRV